MEFHWQEFCSVRVDGKPKGQPRGRAFALKRCPEGHHFQPAKAACPKCGKPGTVQARVHDAGTAESWKSLIAEAFRPRLPDVPLDEPVRVDLDLYFPRPQTFTKRIRKAYGGRSKDIPRGPVLHLSKPDRDNADKAVLDALTDLGFIRDDSLACWGVIRKFYHGATGRPGARVRVMVYRPVLAAL